MTWLSGPRPHASTHWCSSPSGTGCCPHRCTLVVPHLGRRCSAARACCSDPHSHTCTQDESRKLTRALPTSMAVQFQLDHFSGHQKMGLSIYHPYVHIQGIYFWATSSQVLSVRLQLATTTAQFAAGTLIAIALEMISEGLKSLEVWPETLSRHNSEALLCSACIWVYNLTSAWWPRHFAVHLSSRLTVVTEQKVWNLWLFCAKFL